MSATEPEDSSEPVEIEWQFDTPDLAAVERRLASGPLEIVRDGRHRTFSVTAKPSRRQMDRYFDTADWRIARAGLVLRWRHTEQAGPRPGGDSDTYTDEVTLKGRTDVEQPVADGPAVPRRRLELTEPLPAEGIAGLHKDATRGPVGTRVRALAGRHALVPVLEVRTNRQRYTVQSDGRTLAEVALDDTGFGREGSHSHPEGLEPRLLRTEVEVTSGLVDDLEPLVEELRVACGLRPASLSKFDTGLRAFGIVVAGPPDLGPLGISRASTLGELAVVSLRTHLGALLAREPGARLGDDPEEVHRMRVATRRLRSVIGEFSEVLPPRALELREELAWLGRALGAVRDLDVQVLHLDELGANKEVRVLFDEELGRARNELLDVLDSSRWDRLAAALVNLARRLPPGAPPADRPAVDVVPDLVGRRHRAVMKAARKAESSGLPTDFHRLRVRCKRLRYLLEFASDLYEDRTRPFTRALTEVQDALGAAQDADVAARHLEALALQRDPPPAPSTVFAMGSVAGRRQAEAANILSAAPRHLKVLSGKDWSKVERLFARVRG